jgi:hypothetical protein
MLKGQAVLVSKASGEQHDKFILNKLSVLSMIIITLKSNVKRGKSKCNIFTFQFRK